MAKAWLETNKYAYTEQSLDDDAIRALFKEAYPDVRSVPVVFDDLGNLTIAWKGTTNV